MPTDLEQSIGRTLCWFSVMQYPVTGFEIWKWLIEPARAYDLSEVFRALEMSEWVKGKIEEHDGRYVLKGGKKEIVELRAQKYLDSVKKFRKLRRAALHVCLFSNVRALFAVNSIAWWGTTEQSDIDLFVVTKPQSIWSTRFWVVLPFMLLGARPNDSKQDPFCFSFFASQNALAMNHLRLKEGDHYFAFWLKSMVPVLDRDQNFLELEKMNAWADRMLPNASSRSIHHLHRSYFTIPLFRSFPPFEFIYRSIQQKRFPAVIRHLANTDSRVVITDDMLKFHESDRRAEFEVAYREKVVELLSR